MKISQKIWAIILKEYNVYAYIKKDKMKDFLNDFELLEFYQEKKQYTSSEFLAITNKLSNINLLENKKINDNFFKYIKSQHIDTKTEIYNIITTKDKEYTNIFLDQFIKNKPNIDDLYYFKKYLPKHQLKDLLNNFLKLHLEKYHGEQFWDNFLYKKSINKLLTLLDYSNFNCEELIEWQKIKFKDTLKQDKFNSLMNIKNNNSLLSEKEKYLYTLEITIDEISLYEKTYKKNALLTKILNKKLLNMFITNLNMDKIDSKNNHTLLFITQDKDNYLKNKEIYFILKKEINNIIDFILININKTQNLDTEINNYINTILFKYNLDNDLKDKKYNKSKNKI